MNRTKLIALISLGLSLFFSSCQKSEEPQDTPIGYSSPNIRDFSVSATLEADEKESTPRWLRPNVRYIGQSFYPNIGKIYPKIYYTSNYPFASMVYLKKEGEPTIYRFRRPVLWKAVSRAKGQYTLWPYPDLTNMPLEYDYANPTEYTKGKEAAPSMGGWELIHADDYKVSYGSDIKPVPAFQKGDKWYALAAMAYPAAFRGYSSRSKTVDMTGLWFNSDEVADFTTTWLSVPFTPTTLFWQMSNWQEFTVSEDNTLHLNFDFKPVSPLVIVTVENQAKDFVFPEGDYYHYVGFGLCFGTNNTMAGYYDLGAFNEKTDVGKRAKWVPTTPRRPFKTLEEMSKYTSGGDWPWPGVGLPLNFNTNNWTGKTFQMGGVQHFFVAIPTEMVIAPELPEEERTLFIQPRSNKIDDPQTKEKGFLGNNADPLIDDFRYKVVVGNWESRIYSAIESARIPIASSLIPGRFYQIKIVLLPKE